VTEARLEPAADGHWRLAGALDFGSVPGVWPDLEKVLGEQRSVALSLAGVEQANSAGLVMLLEAIEVARRSGCELVLSDVPSDLRALARMSSCEDLIAGAG
jgi:phospholipid transport system transporter-binding protein